MSDHDRGAYTPHSDAPLSFDARQPVRGSRPAPMMLVISAVVLLVLVIAIVVIYRSGARDADGAPPVVGAPVAEMKSEAPAEAQPVDPATGLQIYQSELGEPAPSEPNFVPPPEEPQARTAPPQMRPAAPVEPAPAPKATPAPQPKAAAPAPVAAAPAPKPAAAPTPAPTSTGGAVVQVGAFSSQALAEQGWSDAIRAVPDAGAGKGRRVEPVESNGKTLYRGYVTGFGSRAEASAFCDKLKAAGRSCFVR